MKLVRQIWYVETAMTQQVMNLQTNATRCKTPIRLIA
jgi:hypothetical protein